jgi:hypothetical protein
MQIHACLDRFYQQFRTKRAAFIYFKLQEATLTHQFRSKLAQLQAFSALLGRVQAHTF